MIGMTTIAGVYAMIAQIIPAIPDVVNTEVRKLRSKYSGIKTDLLEVFFTIKSDVETRLTLSTTESLGVDIKVLLSKN